MTGKQRFRDTVIHFSIGVYTSFYGGLWLTSDKELHTSKENLFIGIGLLLLIGGLWYMIVAILGMSSRERLIIAIAMCVLFGIFYIIGASGGAIFVTLLLLSAMWFLVVNSLEKLGWISKE